MKKPSLAIVRGKFLNAYEMQIFEPLVEKYDMTAFGSLTSYHDTFAFPTRKLPSPMDIPEIPLKMPFLNRLFVDAHYLLGLENALRGYDIVHTAETYYHYTQQALYAKRKGYVKKVIATVLENIPFNNEGIAGRQQFKRNARKQLDHIIALTERTKEALILEGANEKKITVVSHGINTKRFFPRKKKENSKDITILFTGRLEVYKGIYDVLYAFKRLIEDPDIQTFSLHLLVVGNGSEREKLLTTEEKLGIKKYITHKEVPYDKMPDMYRQADIFVAPSKSSNYWVEQYNTGLLEAQASGLPIVTTLSGGIPENVGDAAVLVQPDDFYSIYLALKDYILHQTKRELYAKKARERAEDVHDVNIIAKKIDAVYKSLI